MNIYWKRSLALLTAVIYIATTHFLPDGYASPAAHEKGSSMFESQDSSDPASVRLPESLGVVEDFFEGDSGDTVFLIQDAHSIPSAQQSIFQILEVLNQKYGVKDVGVEGTSGRLDSLFLRAFPNQDKVRDLLGRHIDSGDVVGPVAAAFIGPAEMNFHGIEDWTLYQEGVKYYLESQENTEELLSMWSVKYESWKDRAKIIYTSEQNSFNKILEQFEDEVLGLPEALEALSRLVPFQPESELAFIVEEFKQAKSFEELVPELKTLAKGVQVFLNKHSHHGEIRTERLNFNQEHQAYLTGGLSHRAFALVLRDVIRKYQLKVKVSKDLKQAVKREMQVRDIEGTSLYRELAKYADHAMEKLLTRRDQAAHFEEWKSLRLLKKWMELHLSFDDWNEIQSREHGFTELLEGLKSHELFYESALARDDVFSRKLAKLLNREAQSAVAMIAGGFHTQGLTARFKREGISYVLVRPAIENFPDEDMYADQMAGQVAWTDYFEVHENAVDLYTPFMRYMRDELLKSDVTREDIQNWRNRLIRLLADEKRLREAEFYTRLIDEISPVSQERKNSQSVFLDTWEKNIFQFADKVRSLQGESSLTRTRLLNEIRSFKTAVPSHYPGRMEIRAELLPAMQKRAELRARSEDESPNSVDETPAAVESTSKVEDEDEIDETAKTPGLFTRIVDRVFTHTINVGMFVASLLGVGAAFGMSGFQLVMTGLSLYLGESLMKDLMNFREVPWYWKAALVFFAFVALQYIAIVAVFSSFTFIPLFTALVVMFVTEAKWGVPLHKVPWVVLQKIFLSAKNKISDFRKNSELISKDSVITEEDRTAVQKAKDLLSEKRERETRNQPNYFWRDLSGVAEAFHLSQDGMQQPFVVVNTVESESSLDYFTKSEHFVRNADGEAFRVMRTFKDNRGDDVVEIKNQFYGGTKVLTAQEFLESFVFLKVPTMGYSVANVDFKAEIVRLRLLVPFMMRHLRRSDLNPQEKSPLRERIQHAEKLIGQYEMMVLTLEAEGELFDLDRGLVPPSTAQPEERNYVKMLEANHYQGGRLVGRPQFSLVEETGEIEYRLQKPATALAEDRFKAGPYAFDADSFAHFVLGQPQRWSNKIAERFTDLETLADSRDDTELLRSLHYLHDKVQAGNNVEWLYEIENRIFLIYLKRLIREGRIQNMPADQVAYVRIEGERLVAYDAKGEVLSRGKKSLHREVEAVMDSYAEAEDIPEELFPFFRLYFDYRLGGLKNHTTLRYAQYIQQQTEVLDVVSTPLTLTSEIDPFEKSRGATRTEVEQQRTNELRTASFNSLKLLGKSLQLLRGNISERIDMKWLGESLAGKQISAEERAALNQLAEEMWKAVDYWEGWLEGILSRPNMGLGELGLRLQELERALEELSGLIKTMEKPAENVNDYSLQYIQLQLNRELFEALKRAFDSVKATESSLAFQELQALERYDPKVVGDISEKANALILSEEEAFANELGESLSGISVGKVDALLVAAYRKLDEKHGDLAELEWEEKDTASTLAEMDAISGEIETLQHFHSLLANQQMGEERAALKEKGKKPFWTRFQKEADGPHTRLNIAFRVFFASILPVSFFAEMGEETAPTGPTVFDRGIDALGEAYEDSIEWVLDLRDQINTKAPEHLVGWWLPQFMEAAEKARGKLPFGLEGFLSEWLGSDESIYAGIPDIDMDREPTLEDIGIKIIGVTDKDGNYTYGDPRQKFIGLKRSSLDRGNSAVQDPTLPGPPSWEGWKSTGEIHHAKLFHYRKGAQKIRLGRYADQRVVKSSITVRNSNGKGIRPKSVTVDDYGYMVLEFSGDLDVGSQVSYDLEVMAPPEVDTRARDRSKKYFSEPTGRAPAWVGAELNKALSQREEWADDKKFLEAVQAIAKIPSEYVVYENSDRAREIWGVGMQAGPTKFMLDHELVRNVRGKLERDPSAKIEHGEMFPCNCSGISRLLMDLYRRAGIPAVVASGFNYKNHGGSLQGYDQTNGRHAVTYVYNPVTGHSFLIDGTHYLEQSDDDELKQWREKMAGKKDAKKGSAGREKAIRESQKLDRLANQQGQQESQVVGKDAQKTHEVKDLSLEFQKHKDPVKFMQELIQLMNDWESGKKKPLEHEVSEIFELLRVLRVELDIHGKMNGDAQKLYTTVQRLWMNVVVQNQIEVQLPGNLQVQNDLGIDFLELRRQYGVLSRFLDRSGSDLALLKLDIFGERVMTLDLSFEALALLGDDALKGMTYLHGLKLDVVNVSDLNDVRGLNDLKHVKQVELSVKALDASRGIDSLSQLPALESLDVTYFNLLNPNQVSNADLSGYGKLKNLKSLSIIFSEGGLNQFQDLSFLDGLSELEHLSLRMDNSTPVSPAVLGSGMVGANKNPKLKSLDLSGSFTDNGFYERFSNLESLTLYAGAGALRMVGPQWMPLPQKPIPSLKKLSVGGYNTYNLTSIGQAFPGVEHFHFSNFTLTSMLGDFTEWKNLNSLVLGNSPPMPTLFLQGLTGLKKLEIEGRMTTDHLEVLATEVGANVEELIIQELRVEDESWRVLSRFQKLETLDLQVTFEGSGRSISHPIFFNPRLKNLSLSLNRDNRQSNISFHFDALVGLTGLRELKLKTEGKVQIVLGDMRMNRRLQVLDIAESEGVYYKNVGGSSGPRTRALRVPISGFGPIPFKNLPDLKSIIVQAGYDPEGIENAGLEAMLIFPDKGIAEGRSGGVAELYSAPGQHITGVKRIMIYSELMTPQALQLGFVRAWNLPANLKAYAAKGDWVLYQMHEGMYYKVTRQSVKMISREEFMGGETKKKVVEDTEEKIQSRPLRTSERAELIRRLASQDKPYFPEEDAREALMKGFRAWLSENKTSVTSSTMLMPQTAKDWQALIESFRTYANLNSDSGEAAFRYYKEMVTELLSEHRELYPHAKSQSIGTSRRVDWLRELYVDSFFQDAELEIRRKALIKEEIRKEKDRLVLAGVDAKDMLWMRAWLKFGELGLHSGLRENQLDADLDIQLFVFEQFLDVLDIAGGFRFEKMDAPSWEQFLNAFAEGALVLSKKYEDLIKSGVNVTVSRERVAKIFNMSQNLRKAFEKWGSKKNVTLNSRLDVDEALLEMETFRIKGIQDPVKKQRAVLNHLNRVRELLKTTRNERFVTGHGYLDLNEAYFELWREWFKDMHEGFEGEDLRSLMAGERDYLRPMLQTLNVLSAGEKDFLTEMLFHLHRLAGENEFSELQAALGSDLIKLLRTLSGEQLFSLAEQILNAQDEALTEEYIKLLHRKMKGFKDKFDVSNPQHLRLLYLMTLFLSSESDAEGRVRAETQNARDIVNLLLPGEDAENDVVVKLRLKALYGVMSDIPVEARVNFLLSLLLMQETLSGKELKPEIAEVFLRFVQDELYALVENGEIKSPDDIAPLMNQLKQRFYGDDYMDPETYTKHPKLKAELLRAKESNKRARETYLKTLQALEKSLEGIQTEASEQVEEDNPFVDKFEINRKLLIQNGYVEESAGSNVFVHLHSNILVKLTDFEVSLSTKSTVGIENAYAVAVLMKLKGISSVALTQDLLGAYSQAEIAAIEGLVENNDIKRLSLEGFKLENQKTQIRGVLEKANKLKRLRIVNSDFNSDELLASPNSRSISVLTLENVSDLSSYKKLFQELSGLRVLKISKTGSGFEVLKDLKNPEELEILSIPKEVSAEYLSKMNGLKSLELNGVTRSGVERYVAQIFQYQKDPRGLSIGVLFAFSDPSADRKYYEVYDLPDEILRRIMGEDWLLRKHGAPLKYVESKQHLSAVFPDGARLRESEDVRPGFKEVSVVHGEAGREIYLSFENKTGEMELRFLQDESLSGNSKPLWGIGDPKYSKELNESYSQVDGVTELRIASTFPTNQIMSSIQNPQNIHTLQIDGLIQDVDDWEEFFKGYKGIEFLIVEDSETARKILNALPNPEKVTNLIIPFADYFLNRPDNLKRFSSLKHLNFSDDFPYPTPTERDEGKQRSRFNQKELIELFRHHPDPENFRVENWDKEWIDELIEDLEESNKMKEDLTLAGQFESDFEKIKTLMEGFDRESRVYGSGVMHHAFRVHGRVILTVSQSNKGELVVDIGPTFIETMKQKKNLSPEESLKFLETLDSNLRLKVVGTETLNEIFKMRSVSLHNNVTALDFDYNADASAVDWTPLRMFTSLKGLSYRGDELDVVLSNISMFPEKLESLEIMRGGISEEYLNRVKNALKKFTGIKRIHLDELKSVESYLGALPNPEIIEDLKLQSSELADRSRAGNLLEGFKGLRQLRLEPFEKGVMLDILKSLPNPERLQKFDLYPRGVSFPFEVFKNKVSGIMRSFSGLEDVMVYGFKDDETRALLGALPNKSKLRTLNLDFVGPFGGEWESGFLNDFRGIKNLKLSFRFGSEQLVRILKDVRDSGVQLETLSFEHIDEVEPVYKVLKSNRFSGLRSLSVDRFNHNETKPELLLQALVEAEASGIKHLRIEDNISQATLHFALAESVFRGLEKLEVEIKGDTTREGYYGEHRAFLEQFSRLKELVVWRTHFGAGGDNAYQGQVFPFQNEAGQGRASKAEMTGEWRSFLAKMYLKLDRDNVPPVIGMSGLSISSDSPGIKAYKELWKATLDSLEFSDKTLEILKEREQQGKTSFYTDNSVKASPALKGEYGEIQLHLETLLEFHENAEPGEELKQKIQEAIEKVLEPRRNELRVINTLEALMPGAFDFKKIEVPENPSSFANALEKSWVGYRAEIESQLTQRALEETARLQSYIRERFAGRELTVGLRGVVDQPVFLRTFVSLLQGMDVKRMEILGDAKDLTVLRQSHEIGKRPEFIYRDMSPGKWLRGIETLSEQERVPSALSARGDAPLHRSFMGMSLDWPGGQAGDVMGVYAQTMYSYLLLESALIFGEKGYKEAKEPQKFFQAELLRRMSLLGYDPKSIRLDSENHLTLLGFSLMQDLLKTQAFETSA